MNTNIKMLEMIFLKFLFNITLPLNIGNRESRKNPLISNCLYNVVLCGRAKALPYNYYNLLFLCFYIFFNLLGNFFDNHIDTCILETLDFFLSDSSSVYHTPVDKT